MPRNQNSGNLALRNRNRVTNKTRLKVIKGNIDADPIVLDEDEERARVVSTAGVDAEDANEHHLQAVLSAASHRATTVGQRATRALSEKSGRRNEPPAAFIPVPDAAGVVDNYSELYPADRWTEPSTYLKFSDTVDECIRHAIAEGFTYFMDERDEEWLEKNNQEARGEGTSAQAAAASGTTTRSGGTRGAKFKGKDPEPNAPIEMSEGQFELVMGVFEKVTHDNTPFLHLSLQQGPGVPPFSNYQDVFSSELPSSVFATCVVPLDIPSPSMLSRMARVVYPYWRDRRVEREGHRIIPALNFDESDTKNESYICFRRREIKAVRKTRATQVTSSDKLLRLKNELNSSLELARLVLARENWKREAAREAQHVWEKRVGFVDLKRKFPGLGAKEDEDLLFDKERLPKKAKTLDTPSQVLRIKNRASGDAMLSPAPSEPHLRPKDRTNMIHSLVEDHLKRQKERDHHWDDQIDNPYQAVPVPLPERLFKPALASVSPNVSSERSPRHIRLRVGRGGRMHMDRRLPAGLVRQTEHDFIHADTPFPQKLQGRDKADLEEESRRVAERWKFDPDAIVPNSEGDEEDRVLLDDFKPRFLRHSMHLLQEHDHAYLATDPRLFFPDGNNGVNIILPFRVAVPMQARRDGHNIQRPQLPPMAFAAQQAAAAPHPGPASASSGATPVSMQTPVRKMAPPTGQQPRAPSNGQLRPPGTPAVPNMQLNVSVAQSGSPPNSTPPGGGTGMNGAAQVGAVNTSPQSAGSGQMNGSVALNHQPQVNTAPTGLDTCRPEPTARPKSQNQVIPPSQQIAISASFPNGMANGAFNGLTNGVPNGYANHPANQHHILSLQQAQNLKVAFAGIPSQAIPTQPSLPPNSNGPQRPPSAYAQHMANGVNVGNGGSFNMVGTMNMNLKLPPTRQMQWSTAGQRTPQVPNGNTSGTDTSHSPTSSYGSPVIRVPSANGHHIHSSPPGRGAQSPPNHLVGHSQAGAVPNIHGHHGLGHHQLGLGHSPPQAHSSPPQAMQNIARSPSHQHQQIVNGVNQGQGF